MMGRYRHHRHSSVAVVIKAETSHGEHKNPIHHMPTTTDTTAIYFQL